jgi:integrase/recombinase XerD
VHISDNGVTRDFGRCFGNSLTLISCEWVDPGLSEHAADNWNSRAQPELPQVLHSGPVVDSVTGAVGSGALTLTRPRPIRRHVNAPLFAERDAYLRFLRSQCRSRGKLKDAANYTVHVVKALKLTELRRFSVPELRSAAITWSDRGRTFPLRANSSRAAFLRFAKELLRFHEMLIEDKKWNDPFDNRVALYKRYLSVELGFAPSTTNSRIWHLNHFLSWLAREDISLASVTVAHVERYLDFLGAVEWKQRTICSTAGELKVFFRFAERKRWSARGISQAIFGPKHPTILRKVSIERGPRWKDVRRLIDSTKGANANDYRARAILVLLSSYGLRTGEICQLLLTDVNFVEGILSIRRSKSRITQRFPLNREVTATLKQYLQKGRPNRIHPNFFLTVREPYGPIQQASVYNITRTRINRLGIQTVNKGGHAIRHSCANHLLRAGTPVPEVASLLGHASSRYIGTYIQHSVRELRSVADFRLQGLWTFKKPSRTTLRESA